MKLKVVGTGSSGNCYLLYDDNGNVLVLDCGITLDRVKKALDFKVSAIKGVYCTHAHLDHFRYLNDFRLMGCDVFAPHEEIGKKASRYFKPWYIRCFKLPHGETSSYGALIEHDSGEKILYLTDLEYCPFNFKKQRVNHILIECNYQPEYVDLDAPNKEHKLTGHCSLPTAVEFVKQNRTDALESVTLIHAGMRTVDRNECLWEIRMVASNSNVFFAKNGDEFNLNKGDINNDDGRRRDCTGVQSSGESARTNQDTCGTELLRAAADTDDSL